MDIVPVFSMSQDQRALVLDNLVAVYDAADAKTPRYRNTVRVVSVPSGAEDPAAGWSANEGEALRSQTSALLAESLAVALRDMAGASAAAAQKTWRYPEGGTERMERAVLLSEACERRVLKNLRGWLLSVPKADPDRSACGTATAVAGPAAGSQ
jgi:hypothetical protein